MPETTFHCEQHVESLEGLVLDDRYRLDEALGAGGMGRVYRARELAVDRDVAVKVLHAHLRTSQEQVGRFVREIRATAQLRHPNTISLYGSGKTAEGRLYYAMELLEGGQTLREILDCGETLPLDRALRIIAQVCGSLGEAHGADIIHRDLKPDNIMVRTSVGQPDFVTVLDFGLAKLLNPGPESLKITADGALFGSPAYMAPELGEAAAGNSRSDVYAIGCIAYELLTGRPPYTGTSPFAVLMKHMNEPPPPWTETERVVLPRPVRALVDSMLAKNPDDRPADAADAYGRVEVAAARVAVGGSGRRPHASHRWSEPPKRPDSTSVRKAPPRSRHNTPSSAERSSDTINIPPMFARDEANGVLVIDGEETQRPVVCTMVGIRRLEVQFLAGGNDLQEVVQVRVGAPMSPVDDGVVWVEGAVDGYQSPKGGRGAKIQVRLTSSKVPPRYRHMVQYWSKKKR